MQKSNFERMIELADEVFSSKKDPQQLDVNEDVMDGLYKNHPACLSEYEEGEGPLAWVIVIPTSKRIMNAFIKNDVKVNYPNQIKHQFLFYQLKVIN